MRAWQRNAATISTLCLWTGVAVLAAPKNSPPKEDYESWNTKWFASSGGESFVVNVSVSNPKSGGSHTFKASFMPGSGICAVGADAPQARATFLDGTMNNGKLTGTISVCTGNQVLVDANKLSAIFTRKFQASYSVDSGSITDAIYKNEYYKRSEADTKDTSRSQASVTPGAYQRDEPGDTEYAFEMHRYRGPAYDQVTPSTSGGQPTSPASQAQQKVNDAVGQGVHDWMNSLRAKLGAPKI